MRRCAIETIAAMAFVLLPTAASARQTLHFLTEESGRFAHVENGGVEGIFVDELRDTATRADVDASFELLPWKRAYDGALEDPNSCVFATTMTEERRPLFKWVAPLLENDWALIALKSRHIRLKTLGDARPFTIGVYQGDAREAYLRDRGFTVAPVGRNALNAADLLAGRIDLWASSALTPLQIDPTESDQMEAVLTFRTVELGLACNIAVPDPVIARLNRALAQVRAERGDAGVGGAR